MEQLMKWLCAWATLFQGIAGVFTFGYWFPSWQLNQAKRLSRWRMK